MLHRYTVVHKIQGASHQFHLEGSHDINNIICSMGNHFKIENATDYAAKMVPKNKNQGGVDQILIIDLGGLEDDN